MDPVGAAGPDHFVADLDGDGIVDLVINGDGILPSNDPLVSRAYWLVYFGGASGFASEGVQWRIPYPITDENGQPNTADRNLIDLTGDGLLDWVVTKDDHLPENDPLVGRAYWLVYANTGAGFAESPNQWRLPFPMGDDSSIGSRFHNVGDLDGDGAVDLLVHHDDILPSEDPLIGRAYWMVYPNTGAGFGDGAQWRLPFSLVDGQDRSQLGSDAHAFFDLTGDGLGDLVVYDDRLVDDPLLSRAYWLVYANNGGGFDADPTQWRLPFSVRNGDRGTIGGPEHQLVNWDGDDTLDLLVYANGLLDADDPLIGRAYWLMFPNVGDGFSGDAVQWRLPFSLADEDGRPFGQHHTVWALDSQCPALVLYDDTVMPSNDPLISRAYWSVHP